MDELTQTMEAEGWSFNARCRSFMACTMSIHMYAPDGSPHAVKDLGALQRYFGTPEQRAAAMRPTAKASS